MLLISAIDVARIFWNVEYFTSLSDNQSHMTGLITLTLCKQVFPSVAYSILFWISEVCQTQAV